MCLLSPNARSRVIVAVDGQVFDADARYWRQRIRDQNWRIGEIAWQRVIQSDRAGSLGRHEEDDLLRFIISEHIGKIGLRDMAEFAHGKAGGIAQSENGAIFRRSRGNGNADGWIWIITAAEVYNLKISVGFDDCLPLPRTPNRIVALELLQDPAVYQVRSGREVRHLIRAAGGDRVIDGGRCIGCPVAVFRSVHCSPDTCSGGNPARHSHVSLPTREAIRRDDISNHSIRLEQHAQDDEG